MKFKGNVAEFVLTEGKREWEEGDGFRDFCVQQKSKHKGTDTAITVDSWGAYVNWYLERVY